jgi:hypothetical protein
VALNAPTANTFWGGTRPTGTASSYTVTSASFTPAANALLVCAITLNVPLAAHNVQVTSVTSAGLTWTRSVQCAYTGAAAVTVPAGGTAQAGSAAEVWTATTGAAPAATTVAIVMPVTGNASNQDIEAQVVMFTDSGGSVPVIGAKGTASSGSGLPSLALTCAAGSYMLAARSDWAALGAGTLGTTPAATAVYNAGNTDFAYAAWRTTATTSAGSVTLNMTAPAAQNFNMAGLEVQPPAAVAVTRPQVRIVRQAMNRAASF